MLLACLLGCSAPWPPYLVTASERESECPAFLAPISLEQRHKRELSKEFGHSGVSARQRLLFSAVARSGRSRPRMAPGNAAIRLSEVRLVFSRNWFKGGE